VYGDKDVRAPLTVAEDLHAAISGSTLVVLPDTGAAQTKGAAAHLEQPEEAELCAVLTGHWPAAGGWIKRHRASLQHRSP